jgi:acyl-CoA synthetase (AMP-forming)/AMP-acid ligase II
VLLDWIDDPRADRGIRLLQADGSWLLRDYAELAAAARRVAAVLDGHGAAGSVVSIVISDPWTFIASFMGTWYAGMVPSPLATPLGYRKTSHYVAHVAAVLSVARPAVVLTDGALADLAGAAITDADLPAPVAHVDAHEVLRGSGHPDLRIPTARVERTGTDLALLQFTSGSTGAPKGVRVSWDNLNANVRAIRRWLRWGSDDVFASWLPLYHDMGLVGGMITPLASGTDLWLMTPEQFIRCPVRWLDCFGTRGATMTTAPSFGYAYCVRRVAADDIAHMDFSRWRVAILGAERIESAAISAFHELVRPRGFDARVLVGAYGLAEGTLAVSGVVPGAGSQLVRTKSDALSVGEPVEITGAGVLGVDTVGGAGWLTACGGPLPGLDVRIVDDAGRELPDRTFGEIRFAGPSLAQGYLSAGGVTSDFPATGLHSGDAGFVHDGQLYVVGRIGESMKVRGASLHAEDVESELRVLDAAPADGRCAAAFGSFAAQDFAVVFVEDAVDDRWLHAAADRLGILTAGTARVLVLAGKRGSIARTSSGKARRRVMWSELVAGTGPRWRPLYGDAPDGLEILRSA